MYSPSPKLLVIAGQICDKSHEDRQRDEASNHVIVVPFIDGIPYHGLALLRGDFFIIDGFDRIWLQNKQGVGKDSRQYTSAKEKW